MVRALPASWTGGPERLEPYSQTLEEATEQERRQWSERIVAELEERLGDLSGVGIEIHASPAFYESGLIEGLTKAGAKPSIGGAEEATNGAGAVSAPKNSPKEKRTSRKAESPAPEPIAAALFGTDTADRPRRRRSLQPDPDLAKVSASERRETLDEFYALLDEQAEAIGGHWTLPDCSGDDYWPDHGMVFFFEPGEVREDGKTPRVVRVSTHALTEKSKTRLWDRLRSDRGTVGGSNPGAGNHRASALRRHLGRALLGRDGFTSAAASWGIAGNVSPEMKQRELELEIAVSDYLATMSFVWMAMPEMEDRIAVERLSVSLLSNLGREPVDPPSPDWLGHHAGESISAAGLWNIEHTNRAPEPGLLSLLRRHLDG